MGVFSGKFRFLSRILARSAARGLRDSPGDMPQGLKVKFILQQYGTSKFAPCYKAEFCRRLKAAAPWVPR